MRSFYEIREPKQDIFLNKRAIHICVDETPRGMAKVSLGKSFWIHHIKFTNGWYTFVCIGEQGYKYQISTTAIKIEKRNKGEKTAFWDIKFK